MNSLKLSDHDKPKFTAKGIKKSFASNHLKHEHFLQTLETKTKTFAKFRNFRSTNHTIETHEISKVCLAAFDDKRYIRDDGKTSWAYGHKEIRLFNMCTLMCIFVMIATHCFMNVVE